MPTLSETTFAATADALVARAFGPAATDALIDDARAADALLANILELVFAGEQDWGRRPADAQAEYPVAGYIVYYSKHYDFHCTCGDAAWCDHRDLLVAYWDADRAAGIARQRLEEPPF